MAFWRWRRAANVVQDKEAEEIVSVKEVVSQVLAKSQPNSESKEVEKEVHKETPSLAAMSEPVGIASLLATPAVSIPTPNSSFRSPAMRSAKSSVGVSSYMSAGSIDDFRDAPEALDSYSTPLSSSPAVVSSVGSFASTSGIASFLPTSPQPAPQPVPQPELVGEEEADTADVAAEASDVSVADDPDMESITVIMGGVQTDDDFSTGLAAFGSAASYGSAGATFPDPDPLTPPLDPLAPPPPDTLAGSPLDPLAHPQDPLAAPVGLDPQTASSGVASSVAHFEALRVAAEAVVNQSKFPRRSSSTLSRILGQPVRGARSVQVNTQQLEKIESCIAEMEEKCETLNSSLGSKSVETEVVRSRVRQVLHFIREERAQYGAALKNLKEGLTRSREDRRNRLQKLQKSQPGSTPSLTSTAGTTPMLMSSGSSSNNTPLVSDPSTPLTRGYPGRTPQLGPHLGGPEPMALAGPVSAMGPMALTGPQNMMALPGPARGMAPGTNQAMTPVQRGAVGRSLAAAQQLAQRGQQHRNSPAVRGQHNSLVVRGQHNSLVVRGARDVAVAGQASSAGGQDVAAWQPEGLLMPLDEYQNIESRKDRARAGNCLMAIPPMAMGMGMGAARRRGERNSRPQRWVVDSSWMEALRTEFSEMQRRLGEAEHLNGELQQIVEEKDLMESNVLQLIETKQRHDHELQELLTQVLNMDGEHSAPALAAPQETSLLAPPPLEQS